MSSRIHLLPWILGGILGAAGYFIYTYSIFGSFTSPYAHEADPFFREQMSKGFMGATRPRLLVAWLVTLHPFQGLFLWFPITALATAGLIWGLVRGGRIEKAESAAALLIFAALLLFNSAYFMWWGGWSYAPRHLIPALPLMALGLVPWMRAKKPAVRWAVVAIGFAGAVMNLSAVALDPQPPPGPPQELLLEPHRIQNWPSPMLMLLRHVWRHDQTDHNWGTAMGLNGPISLLPLVLVWLIGLFAATRRHN